MKSNICYIVCAGENYGIDFLKKNGDLVIAADAGLEYLNFLGITPDTVIGDFDSLGYSPKGENVIKLNTCKDETDALSAVQYGFSSGYSHFRIYCATGGRIDHTISNIQLLSYIAERGGTGELFDKDSVLTVIKNSEFRFKKRENGYISVFSLTDESVGVHIKNLKYELENARITSTFPVGTSNEFVGKEGSIGVKEGTLLIVYPREKA